MLVMLADKIMAWDKILIHEDEIIALSCQNGLVQDRCLAETLIFVPNMSKRQFRLIALNQITGALIGPVVGDDDLIGRMNLIL